MMNTCKDLLDALPGFGRDEESDAGLEGDDEKEYGTKLEDLLHLDNDDLIFIL